MAEHENSEQPGSDGDVEPLDWQARYHDLEAKASEWERKASQNAAAASELAKLKESNLAETRKLTQRAETAERELAELKAQEEQQRWRNEASRATGVPVELLRGSSEQEIREHADMICAFVTAKDKPAAASVKDPAGTPDTDAAKVRVGLLNQLFGRSE